MFSLSQDSRRRDRETCPRPTRQEKDAAGSFDRTIAWDLIKNVNTEGQDFEKYVRGPGSVFPTDWLIYVDQTVTDDNYSVTGNITITNSAATPQNFSVLNDGTVATVTCPDGGDGTVPAASGGVDGSITCTYAASPADGSGTLNTATVSATGNPDQTATCRCRSPRT